MQSAQEHRLAHSRHGWKHLPKVVGVERKKLLSFPQGRGMGVLVALKDESCSPGRGVGWGGEKATHFGLKEQAFKAQKQENRGQEGGLSRAHRRNGGR